MRKFDELKNQGEQLKKEGHLQEALLCYKDALAEAETKDDKNAIWNFILHVHTDRMLASLQELAEIHECDVSQLDWNWGSHRIPSNYNRPSTEELLK